MIVQATKETIMIKFALSKEQRLHFEKHHFLEIEEMLESEQLQHLKKEIDQLSHPSLPNIDDEWESLSQTEKRFAIGHDLWRKSNLIKKFTLDKHLAQIASELTGEKFLRIGYDQFFPNIVLEKPAYGTHERFKSKYAFWLQKEASIGDLSCIQGVVCGLLLCLNAPESEISTAADSVFSLKAGNIVLFSPLKMIALAELQKRPGQEFLLLTYAEKRALYIPNENDPHQHSLKQMGYVFGDRLNDNLNPVLCR